MRKILLLAGLLLFPSLANAQQTATYGTLVTSLNTTSTGAVTGTAWAVPSSYAALIQWTVVADGSALSANLMCSLDNSSYFVVDTQTTAAGGTKQFGFTACKFIRIDAVSRTGGTGTVGTLVTSRGFITSQDAGNLSSLIITGQIRCDGTVALPCYSFLSQNNKGFYHSGTDGIGISVAGAQRYVLTDGNFFIRNSGPSLSIGASGQEVFLYQDAANIGAFRNLTNPNTVRVYNTTDAGLINYERASNGWNANVYELLIQQGGTGSARSFRIGTSGLGDLAFRTNGSDRWKIDASAGHFLASSDNTYDIGASGATRPRNVFLGGGLVFNTQLRNGGSAPTCSSNCGTSPSISGGDVAGTVTMGSSGVPASGWIVTFTASWAVAPSCVVQMAKAGMVVGKMPLTVVTSTSTFTVVTNGTAPATGDMYHYHCIGIQ